ncbi:hypothetical protein LXA43DRAFT_194926 [Ganoderma leucocontextum]|nr:hypothetical protein LXA43DRAFT_194926 [Ganoderma leucocontextum]
MSQYVDTEQRVQEFNKRLAKDQSGASEVQDFMLRTSYAFPSTDVLVPAPMTVSILGQLTIVATATDFKLVVPKNGFEYARYPDSFRATIMQLVNAGARALNQSYVNFDEINKRCGTVPLAVNDIIQLLVGHKDNTPEQNDMAVQRHLPRQVESLKKTIEACLAKAKETDKTFNELLALTMEIHESCAATQGENESQIREAELRKAYLQKEEEAAKEMKRIGQEALEQARAEYADAQKMFNDAVTSVPSGWELLALDLVDTLTNTLVVGLNSFITSRVPGPPPPSQGSTVPPSSGAPVAPNMSDVTDPGYRKAPVLRTCAERLYTLLTVNADGQLDWDSIKSPKSGGCLDIGVQCDEVIKSLQYDNRNAGDATTTAIGLAKKGKELANTAGDIVPPGSPGSVEQVTKDTSTWRDEVVKFASKADLKLNAPLLNHNVFTSPPSNDQYAGSKADAAMQAAQYKIAITQAQLNASRESSKAATDKLMEVNGQLGHLMAELAKIDVQKQNWKEIADILRKAISFLCELKTYLNSLVHFFDWVYNFVSLSFKGAADQFITVVKDTGGIEDQPRDSRMKQVNGVTLDAWSREAIYKHALSTAKLSKVVQHVSGMYVTLYNKDVHPGVNMLLRMGGLVGANDANAVAKAGRDIQDWAQAANDHIVELIAERMQANEADIEKRMGELENSFGVILPKSSRIQEIAHDVEKKKVEEVSLVIESTARANLVYGSNPFI